MSAPAFAATVSCESPASLRGRARACEENAVYSRAAKLCLDRFSSAIAESRRGLTDSLAKLAVPGQQAHSLEGAKSGYREAVGKLKSLAALGAHLRTQIEVYEKEVVWPEDFGAAAGAGLRAETFLQNQPCYHETQKLLDSYGELMGLYAEQVALTAKIAAGLAARALKGEQKLDFESALPSLGPGQGVAAPRSKPARPAGNGQSDITGTEKKAPDKR